MLSRERHDRRLWADELNRVELVREQIKAVKAGRDALLNAERTKVSAPPLMLLGVHGLGPEFVSIPW